MSNARPTSVDFGLLIMATMAMASSAVLVRWTVAPAIALALWRTLGGSLLLAPSALGPRGRSAATRGLDRRTALLVLGAGGALGAHFATWLASLEMTSVAASVTLVSTTPVFVALFNWALGHGRPSKQTTLVIACALAGTIVIAVGDATSSTPASAASADAGEALIGDGLALLGAMAMAVYLMLGTRARARLPTDVYATLTYGVAAAVLFPVALATGTQLWGYDGKSWLAIGAMVLGPQLAGHTVLNYLVDRLGALTLSLVVLTEPVGAATLTWLIFGDVPPWTAWLGAVVVIAALATHVVRSEGSSADPGTVLTS